MPNEGDKAAVLRSTQVRTKLRGDASWLQRRQEPETKTEEEKPWMAEVRARRLNGAPIETSPVTSPVTSTPPPTKSDTERARTPGYLIRGVFTKPDKPASSSATNGFSGVTQFTKKPSETYKRIAPHTVRSTSEKQEGQLSTAEQEKRTEAASSVLQKSAAKQRSYVFSAAKKYESKEPAPDTSLVNSSVSFVAKRVEITDDDESAATPAPASAVAPSPVVSITSAASAPQPKPRKTPDAAVKTAVDVVADEPAAPKVVGEATPEPVKEDPAPVSVTGKDPFEGMKPGCTKVATPLPELITECLQAAATKPEPEDSDISAQADTLLVDLSPSSETPLSPTPASPPAAVSLSTLSPTLISPTPISPLPVSSVTAITVKTEPEPQPEPEPEPEPESKQSPKPSSGTDTLTTLSNTLISFNTSESSSKDDEPALAEEDSAESDAAAEDSDQDSVELGQCGAATDDLLHTDSDSSEEPEEPAEPVPPSPGRWSQDLLGGLNSESSPAKTSATLDLLTNDVIVVNTEPRSLSMQREEEKQTDETAKETQSGEDNAGTWSSRVTTIVTESSSADPFDPYPIGTTSPNSSSDLLQPLSDISINSSSPASTENKNTSSEIIMSGDALGSLADDVIPINTDATSLSTQRSWTRTWETSTTRRTEESRDTEPEAEGQPEYQQTMVMFERKSKENDSPWDRWTSPTVYTITTRGEEEEEAEEEEEESGEETHTVTTITTIRETRSEPEPVMDRPEVYSRTVIEEQQRVQTPDPEAKKGFVYVKEYVNASETSLLNATDGIDRGSDYLTSNSIGYSYGGPSIYSRVQLSSTCTYCGEQVGNDSKITIEHLNINCHPHCFKCEGCNKPMGDLLDSMFLHGGKVHCQSCYAAL